MKALGKAFITLAVILCSANMVFAQSMRKERLAAKIAGVKKMIENRNYVFQANLAYPQRGGSISLRSGEYDLRVSKDSVISYLPYFGRAYVARTDPT